MRFNASPYRISGSINLKCALNRMRTCIRGVLTGLGPILGQNEPVCLLLSSTKGVFAVGGLRWPACEASWWQRCTLRVGGICLTPAALCRL